MLILSRKETQTVVFPELNITVEISNVQGKTVRLGIEAPRSIKILRGELEKLPDFQQQLGGFDFQNKDAMSEVSAAIRMAIYAMRNGHQENGERLLGEALECLQKFEHQSEPMVDSVCEPTSGYRVDNTDMESGAPATTPMRRFDLVVQMEDADSSVHPIELDNRLKPSS